VFGLSQKSPVPRDAECNVVSCAWRKVNVLPAIHIMCGRPQYQWGERDARIESFAMGQGQQGSMHTKLRVAQYLVAQEDFQDLGACSGMQVP